MNDKQHDQFEKDELFKKSQESASKNLENSELFDQTIFQTLDSFAHRYIQSDSSNNSQTIKQSDFHYVIASVETNMKAALKIDNTQVRDQLIKHIQEVGLKNQPKIFYSIEVKLSHEPSTEFVCHVQSCINWNHPEYTPNSTKQSIVSRQFDCQDSLFLRNNLACFLEEVCQQFL